jgi:hypothetical protein
MKRNEKLLDPFDPKTKKLCMIGIGTTFREFDFRGFSLPTHHHSHSVPIPHPTPSKSIIQQAAEAPPPLHHNQLLPPSQHQ